MSKYDTNLAAEFYVLSVLHRLGAEPSLTLANKKAVDIYVAAASGGFRTIDVKGIAGKYDWPASNVTETSRSNHFYVLVSFEGSIEDPTTLPSVWVIPGTEISYFIRQYKTRRNISRALVSSDGGIYLNAWNRILDDPQ